MKLFYKTLTAMTFMLASGYAQSAEVELTSEQLKTANLATIAVTARENVSRIKLTGVLTSDLRKSYRIAPVVEGMVTELHIVAYDHVRAGQLMARLRSDSLGQAQADYLESLSRFELAKTENDRIEGLREDGIVSESRLLKANSEYKIARANFEQNRRLLSLTGLSDQQMKALEERPDRLAEFDLTSPIDGIVTVSTIERGQQLAAGEAAFHVDDLTSLWLEVQIPVATLPLVAIGAEAQIRVPSSPDRLFRGELQSLGGEVNSNSQTLAGRIVVGNPEAKLFPGMYAEVTLSGSDNQGLTVPASAVFRIGAQAYVFRALSEARFDPVPVSLGAEVDDLISIHNGLEIGDTIVTRGVAELKSHWQYQEGE